MSARLDALLKSPPDEVTASLSLGGAELTFPRWLDVDLALSLVLLLCAAPAVSGGIRWALMGKPVLEVLGVMVFAVLILCFSHFMFFFVGLSLFRGLSPFRLPEREKDSGKRLASLAVLFIFGPLPLIMIPAHVLFLGWALWLPLPLFTHDILEPHHVGIIVVVSFMLLVALIVRLSLRRPRLRLTTTSLELLGWRKKLWSLEGLAVMTADRQTYLNGARVSDLSGLNEAERGWLCAVLETASDRREDALEDAGHDLDARPEVPASLRDLQGTRS